MAGAVLGRLWDIHPRVAFVLQLLVTVYLGALAVWLFMAGAAGGGVALTTGKSSQPWKVRSLANRGIPSDQKSD